jgi:hypothetical protein
MTEQEKIRKQLREQILPEMYRLSLVTNFTVRRDEALEKLEALRQALLQRYAELEK